MKKILSFCLILIMLINISTNCFATNSDNVNKKINAELNTRKININSAEIVKIGEAEKHLKYYREDRGYATYVVCSIVGFYENNIFHPAYCMNKEMPGAEDGSYEVNIKEILNNSKGWRIVSNGYPYKSAEQMGLENDYDAFAVTKFAIYCVLGESKLDYYSADESDVRRTKNVRCIKEIS